jgi:hypothetical protein
MSHAMATTPRRPRHFSEAGAWAESGHHTDEGRCSYSISIIIIIVIKKVNSIKFI